MKKNPLIIASSLLGLTIAASSYAVTTSTPTGQSLNNGNSAVFQKDGKYGEKRDGMGKGMKGGMMGGKGMQDLNLTDAQKTQLEQLRTQNQAKMAQFKAQLAQIDANIATQKAAGANTATLLDLYQQKQTVLDQFFAMHQQQRQQFVRILTPEQQLKMYESQNRGGKDGMRKPPMPMGTAQK